MATSQRCVVCIWQFAFGWVNVSDWTGAMPAKKPSRGGEKRTVAGENGKENLAKIGNRVTWKRTVWVKIAGIAMSVHINGNHERLSRIQQRDWLWYRYELAQATHNNAWCSTILKYVNANVKNENNNTRSHWVRLCAVHYWMCSGRVFLYVFNLSARHVIASRFAINTHLFRIGVAATAAPARVTRLFSVYILSPVTPYSRNIPHNVTSCARTHAPIIHATNGIPSIPNTVTANATEKCQYIWNGRVSNWWPPICSLLSNQFVSHWATR